MFQLLPGDLRDRIAAHDDRLTFPMLVSFEGVPPHSVNLLGRNHPVYCHRRRVRLCSSVGGETTLALLGLARSSPGQLIAVPLYSYYGCAISSRPRASSSPRRSWPQHSKEVATASAGFPRSRARLSVCSGTPRSRPTCRRLSARSTSSGRWECWTAIGPIASSAERVSALEAAHARLRRAVKGAKAAVTPHPSPDIIGCYVLVPAGASA